LPPLVSLFVDPTVMADDGRGNGAGINAGLLG
jgi:hypothetical protein